MTSELRENGAISAEAPIGLSGDLPSDLVIRRRLFTIVH